jgi:hypothetical protein
MTYGSELKSFGSSHLSGRMMITAAKVVATETNISPLIIVLYIHCMRLRKIRKTYVKLYIEEHFLMVFSFSIQPFPGNAFNLSEKNLSP